jgi:hypothetical protein
MITASKRPACRHDRAFPPAAEIEIKRPTSMRAAVHRFPHTVFVAAGLRTPFGRGGGALSSYDAISLSVPVVQAMANRAEPDLIVWGRVIPNLGWSNIAREIWLDAKLNPNVPAFSVVLACSTSMTAAFAAEVLRSASGLPTRRPSVLRLSAKTGALLRRRARPRPQSGTTAPEWRHDD